METLKSFLKYQDHKIDKELPVELRSDHDLLKLPEIITPSLEPLNSKEIIYLFTHKEFSDDINQIRKLTTEVNEASFTVLRWAYPRTFYGSDITSGVPVRSVHCTRKDRYMFFSFHSHPLGSVPLPSVEDLESINQITEKTREYLKGEKEFGHLPGNFDIYGFRPIMGIGCFGRPSDGYSKVFGLSLLQLKKDVDQMDFKRLTIQYRFTTTVNEVLAWLNVIPCNFCVLNYKWNEKNKKYTLSSKKELNKLEGFALEAVK